MLTAVELELKRLEQERQEAEERRRQEDETIQKQIQELEQKKFEEEEKEKLVSEQFTHPDPSNGLSRSHIMQYRWGYFEGTVQLLRQELLCVQ